MTAVLSLTERIAHPRLYAVKPSAEAVAAARAQLALLADLYRREVIDVDEPERWLTIYSPLPLDEALNAFGRLVNVAADLDSLDGSDLREAVRDAVHRNFVEDHDRLLAEIVPGGGQ